MKTGAMQPIRDTASRAYPFRGSILLGVMKNEATAAVADYSDQYPGIKFYGSPGVGLTSKIALRSQETFQYALNQCLVPHKYWLSP